MYIKNCLISFPFHTKFSPIRSFFSWSPQSICQGTNQPRKKEMNEWNLSHEEWDFFSFLCSALLLLGCGVQTPGCSQRCWGTHPALQPSWRRAGRKHSSWFLPVVERPMGIMRPGLGSYPPTSRGLLPPPPLTPSAQQRAFPPWVSGLQSQSFSLWLVHWSERIMLGRDKVGN